MVTIKSAKEIECMKEACRVVALVYKELEERIRPGMTTAELDKIAEIKMRELGAIPAQKGYDVGIKGIPPFPAATCISINDEVIHGIPSKQRIIKEGDIVSVDTVAFKNGFHGDAARTFVVGKVSKEIEKLIKVTKQAFFEGIQYAKPGNRIGDVCHAIGEYVHSQGYSVVREFQGHGIGRQMHEDPGIPNYGKAGRGIRLEPGMTLAIEPMVIAGRPQTRTLKDGWGVVTRDGSRTAHFEHTVAIANDGYEILTTLKKEEHPENG